MQVLGGAGYTDDFPLEQHFRDIRVNSIYEGTTTIHGMDLLGRKMVMNNGESVQFLTEEIMKTLQDAMPLAELTTMAGTLGKSLEGVQQVMQKLTGVAKTEGPRAYLADATLFLDYFALHVLGWLWIKQAAAAVEGMKTAEGESEKTFYRSKLQTARYFFNYELPKVSGLKRILLGTEQVTLKTTAEELI